MKHSNQTNSTSSQPVVESSDICPVRTATSRMKPIVTLLIGLFLFSAATTIAFAEDAAPSRSDKVRTEKRAPSKTVEKVKKTVVKKKESRKQATAKTDSKATSRQKSKVTSTRQIVEAPKTRQETQRKDVEAVRGGRSNDESTDNVRQNQNNGNRSGNTVDQNRNDNSRSGNNVDRNQIQDKNTAKHIDRRFKNNHERCNFCMGNGFTFSHDHFKRIRCRSCFGRGFAIGFQRHLSEFCPVCFARIAIHGNSLNRTLEDISRIETNELAFVLNLSNNQARKIYRIHLRYLRDSRHGNMAYLMNVRDRKIMKVLTYNQRDQYLCYLRDVDTRDLCDHCFAIR